LIKYNWVRGDKEMGYYRLLLARHQDYDDFVHQDKYELERMMLVLWKIEGEFIKERAQS
jgi:hypothetical protein